PRAVTRRDARPGTALKSAPRRSDREINVGLGACSNVANDLLGSRVLDGKSLAAAGIDPFAVDEQKVLLGEERGRGQAKGRFADCDGHGSLPAGSSSSE